MNTIYILAIAGTFVTAGDLALAGWARAGQHLLMVAGVLLNIIGILFYAQTLGRENVGMATAIFLGFNIFAVTLGGILLFGENISIARIIGLSLLTVSIILVEVLR